MSVTFLSRIAVPDPTRPKGYYLVVPYNIDPDDDVILYYFSPRVLSSSGLVINAPWRESLRPPLNRIYVRTSQNGPLPTQFRSLAELHALLEPHFFSFIGRSS